MNVVYSLWHVHPIEFSDRLDEKALGIYSSLELAKAAIDQVKDQVGFIDHPDGFRIYEYPLDQPAWTNGFDPAAAPVRPWHCSGQIGALVGP